MDTIHLVIIYECKCTLRIGKIRNMANDTNTLRKRWFINAQYGCPRKKVLNGFSTAEA
jgi:hypothetical protein